MNIPYHQPLSPPHNEFFQPTPPPQLQLGTTDPKRLVANHLHLAAWPQTAEPHLYLNTMEIPTPTNFSCTMKLP
jgi:hypothetical protein